MYLFFSVLIGTAFALYYRTFSLSIFLLLAYVILTYLCNYLIMNYVNTSRHKKRLIAIEILILIIIIYLSSSYSWFLLIVLSITSLLLQLQKVFINFHLNTLYEYLNIVLYIGIINSLAFYIHTQFISSLILFLLVPIVLLFLFFKRW